MAVMGIELEPGTLVHTKGRDWKWHFENLDDNDVPVDFPDGDLFLEFQTGGTPTIWSFDIDGSSADILVESTAADLIPARTVWQLVFLPTGEVAGGDPIATGTFRIQGAAR